ncbi:MAG: CHASE domain-containing protein, partial [Rhodoluna sp.]
MERVADRVIASLQRETDLALAFQSSVAAKIGSSPQIGAREYREFVRALRVFDLLPSIRAIAFARLIERADLMRFVDETNADPERVELGYPAFSPWPEGLRDLYAPAVLVEPQTSNSRVYNFDLYSSYERRATGELAISTGFSQASAPVVLTQDAETGRYSVLVLHPVLANGLPVGLVAMGVTIERLLLPILIPFLEDEVHLVIEDIGPPDARSTPTLLLDLGGKSAGKTVDRSFRFAGRDWQIQIGS